MRRWSLSVIVFLLFSATSTAQQQENFDYWQHNKALITRGVQAFMMCNGLFTSQRTLEQVFSQELAYISGRLGEVETEDYLIDSQRRAVAVGLGDSLPAMRAAYREGLGCIVLAPDQTLDDIDSLPVLKTPPAPGDPAEIEWPDGDLIPEEAWPEQVDQGALDSAAEWAFDRETHGTLEQVTLSLIVVHRGRILLERYAPGVDYLTKTRTWSTAKSIAVTLIGILVDQGKLSLDEPLDIEWLPRARSPESDPRKKITLRHVLNMSSGLYPVDNGLEYATGSGLAYWAGASSARGARNRGLIREPGTYWDYENYDTLLAVYAMKQVIGDDQVYLEFPRAALLDRIGMRNTVPGVDRFGDFILSSQVYTTARDLARFGLLYLNGGTWNGERLISRDWIEFVRTPAPATRERGNFYGGQWWLVPDDRSDVPRTAYSTAGNRGQYVIVVPSHEVVIVRRGLDFGRQGFNRWDLTREVLKAFAQAEDTSGSR
ncbi:MAG TPA: serine hydrolase [Acidobacteriota bacterium]|nr:serine hydrolase [Acidobacteriota bacterium]